MADYFEQGAATGAETSGATNGAAPATNGDAPMDDEIMVSCTDDVHDQVC